MSGEKSPRGDLWPLVLLAAVCFLVFFQGLGTVPFYTRGEGREGLVVWEMLRSGNWILPVINGEYIPFKPPFFHWIGALASLLAGDVNEFTVRFPSALFAALGVGLVYLAASRLWNRRTGVVAALVLALDAEWWRAGSDAQVDMTFAFFMSATLLWFYFMYRSGRQDNTQGDSETRRPGDRRPKDAKPRTQRRHALVLAFLLACAMLSKGPLGLALPALIIVVFLGLRRDLAFLRKLHWRWGAAVFLLTAGGWYAAATWQGGSAFWVRQIVEENFGTAAGSYGHHQPLYYFVPVFFLDLAPWSFFFAPLALFLYRRRRALSETQLLFPLVWFAAVFLVFSVALGKRGVYILPLYPAFALLFAAWWDSLDKISGDAVSRWTAALGVFLAGAVLFVSARVALLLRSAAPQSYRLFIFGKTPRALRHLLSVLPLPSLPMIIALGVLGGAALIVLCSLATGRWNAVFLGVASMAAATTLFVKSIYYPVMAHERTLKPFALRLRHNPEPQAPLCFFRAFDYGTIFYSRRHIGAYKAGASGRPLFLLMWEEDWQRLKAGNDFRMLDISEGRGPVNRHRLVLAEFSGKTVLPNGPGEEGDGALGDNDD